MENTTIQTTSDIRATLTQVTPERRLTVKIKLNDECKNGYEHFSITGNTQIKAKNDRWVEGPGGCIHEDILEAFPNLKPLVNLHLSDQDGIPMHATANGFYWYTGCFLDKMGEKYAPLDNVERCKEILQEHLRANDDQMKILLEMLPANKDEFQYIIESMGFIEQWKHEALDGIKLIQDLAETHNGQKVVFESKAVRTNYAPMDSEKRNRISSTLGSHCASATGRKASNK